MMTFRALNRRRLDFVPRFSCPFVTAPKGFCLHNLQMTFIRQFWHDDSGATSIEYALIASLISLVIITAVTGIGTKLNNKFVALSNKLT